LTGAEASALGLPSSETEGIAFELVSPPPPFVLSGTTAFRTAIDMLSVVKHMGIQAGPSCGFHVHVNLKGSAHGSKFSRKQVAYLFTAYAEYQFAINEMLTPGRIGNKYASSLFLGNCKPLSGSDKVVNNRCGYYRRLFNQLHAWVKKGSSMNSKSDKEFCNYILRMPEESKPCDKHYPKVRYSQFNLVPVDKYGTVEFRGHSATHDIERIMRWVQFCIGFVERFGKGGGGATGTKHFFDESADKDYKDLQRVQQTATMKSLFAQISKGRSHQARKWRQTDFLSYYGGRKWEQGDKHCQPSGPAPTIKPKCNEYTAKKHRFLACGGFGGC
jgi:hypothetical protein